MTRFIFMGYDARDDLAYKVALRSIHRHSSMPVTIIPLKDHELRRAGFYYRSYEVRANGQKIDCRDGKPFSTDFSFSRFCVPELARAMGIHDPVLYADPDILSRTDITELFGLWDDKYAVMCVHHDHKPPDKETTKMSGLGQTRYFRKNWSSVMLLHPDKTGGLRTFHVNNQLGSELHALLWAKDKEIGSLPKEWNHLVGYSVPNPDAKLVHFTLGDPTMEGRFNDEHADEWRSYLGPDERANPILELTVPKPAGWQDYATWPR